MINEILQDFINTGKVASFIDNVIVRTEKDKRHDKVVEEVIKWLAENDLYMKLEKYKWKVRKVGFLGVMIGPEGIKMEGEKMKEVLNWPTLKGVKDIQKFLRLVNYYQQCIKDFVAIVRPLQDLVKKDQK